MVISFKFTFGATQVHGRFIPYTVQYLSSHVAVCNDRQSTLGTHVVGDSGLTQKGSLAFYTSFRAPHFRLQIVKNAYRSCSAGDLELSHVTFCINTVFFGLALYSICRKPAKSATTFVILVVVVCLLCLRNHTGFARPFRRDHVARGQKYGSERRITCVEAPPLDAHFGSLIVIKILGRSSALAVSLLVESLAGSIYCAFWLTQVVLSSLPPTTTVSTALARWAIKSPGSIRH
uniref:Uncharacterized protein n=1 Tax=Mycena chlorophos TaxID=658473 RepID=A0ABQ0LF32_MYCCL|nr:predicted protein [Mycena chlorophos]